MPRPDCDTDGAQGSGALVSPPTPWVEQLGALPPPALEVADPLPPPLGVADPLPPPLEVADPFPPALEVAGPLPPALEVVIVGFATLAVPQAMQAVARTTAPAAIRIRDTGRRA